MNIKSMDFVNVDKEDYDRLIRLIRKANNFSHVYTSCDSKTYYVKRNDCKVAVAEEFADDFQPISHYRVASDVIELFDSILNV